MINETKSSNGDSNEIPIMEVDKLDYNKFPRTTYILFDYDPKKVRLTTGKREYAASEKSIFKHVLFNSQIITLKGEYEGEKGRKKTKKKAISKNADSKDDKEVKKEKATSTKTTKKVAKTKSTKTTKTSQSKEDR